MLPPDHDPRWRSAPPVGGGPDVRFVPYGPPFASPPSSRIDWFREDGALVLLEDGFPAKHTDAGILVHPLHPRYVLDDLLRRHAAEPSTALRGEIERTADAVVGRSEATGGVRRIWYAGAAASGLAAGGRHVSGLPQAYYADLLVRTGRLLGRDDLAIAADAFFAALMLPVASDGAWYDGPPGPSLAMVPMRPRDWILNGWLSMLVAVSAYASGRPSPEAEAVLDRNVETLIRMLPAFDVPHLRLSRYMLPGVVQLGVEIDPSDGVGIRDLAVAIPYEGRFDVPRQEATGWHNRLRPADVAAPDADRFQSLTARSARFVAVISRGPYPESNEVEFEVDSPVTAAVRLKGHLGRYDPTGSRMIERSWQELSQTTIRPGLSRVRLAIPRGAVDLIGYPTSFARTYGGRRLNTYHATHVVRLRQLAARTHRAELFTWAERWRGYVDDWATMPAYEAFGAWSPEGEL